MKRILLPPQFTHVGSLNRAFSTVTFCDFIRRCGAIPIMVIPSTQEEPELERLTEEALDGINGVLLQGGNDIHPQLYGQEINGTQSPLLYRDVFEVALVNEALKRQIPIFGVCRGLQLLNVALGGTLHQHLPHDRWNKHWDLKEKGCEVLSHDSVKELYHTVELREAGVLREVLKRPSVEVNSYHHQGIARLAEGLSTEATAEDSLVEAFSCRERRLLAVQWHPEVDFSIPSYGEPLRFWLNEWT